MKTFLRNILVSACAVAACSAHATPMALAEIVNITTSSDGNLVNDGLYDAFDGAFAVSGYGGLSLQRRLNTLEATRTYRLLDTFTNNTASTVTATVNYRTNLGSDGGGQVVQQNAFTLVTHDGYGYDPVLAFTYGNNAFTSAHAVGATTGYDDFSVSYTISVASGQSLGLLQFSTLIRDDSNRSGDAALAIARSNALLLAPDLSGLSAAEKASIVNFGATQVPEPASAALFGLGLAGLVAARRKRKA